MTKLSRSIAWVISAQLITQSLFMATATAQPLANPSLSRVCRDEIIADLTRQWSNFDARSPISERLPHFDRALDQALQRRDLTLTITTIDLVKRALFEDQTRSLKGSDRQTPIAILDKLLSLTQPLNSGYSNLKTTTLTEAGILYHHLGQPEKATAALQLATQTAPGIRDGRMIVQAYLRLAEGWPLLNRSTDAKTAIDAAFRQTLAQVKAPDVRRMFLTRILRSYLQWELPGKALEAMNQMPNSSDDDFKLRTQIAASFGKTKNFTMVNQLLEPLLKTARSHANLDNRNMQFAMLITDYAPSGDFTRLQQMIAEMKTVSFNRAKAWLAIAGEARKANQTVIRQQAMTQLISDVKSGIGNSFGERFDHQWSGELTQLANDGGYLPERKDLILAIRSPHLMEIVIQDLIDRQQFEAARQAIPNPMTIQIDAAVEDVRNQWLDNVAIAALKAGQPQQAQAIATAEKTDLQRILRYAKAFHDAKNGTIADRLFTQAQSIAHTTANDPNTLDRALEQQANIAITLTQTNRSANPVIDQMETILKREPNLDRRAEILSNLFGLFTPARSVFWTLAERLDLINQTHFATIVGNYSLMSTRNLNDAYRFIGKAGRSPEERLDFILRYVELGLNQGQRRAASVLDMPIRSLLDGPEFSKIPMESRSGYFHTIALYYLRAGDLKSALDVAKYVTPNAERDRLVQRITCYQPS
jgi:hypothetical protein